jgi:hypothetical protein
MKDMRDLLRNKPSPRRMGLYAGILGTFGSVSYGLALISGSGVSRVDSAYYLAMSLLFLAAGVTLWQGTSRGWWLAWAAMLAASFSGFATHAADGWPPDQFPPLFFGGFMLAAGGIFFSMLAHRDVYGPCFASMKLPHAIFGATPALLIIAGAGILTVAGGVGLTAGPFILVASLFLARWLVGPLVALLRGRSEWHAV